MQQLKRRTYHVYVEDEWEEAPTIIDEAPDPESITRHVGLGIVCGVLLSLLCLFIPIATLTLAPMVSTTYDRSISKTLTLTLAQYPAAGQVPLYALSTVSARRQATIAATGSIHQDASQATGLITFYNGAFTAQTVPAGTRLTGKDGITVITLQDAVIPAAMPTTPPTPGTVSVTARSSRVGAAGNISVSDIDQACCGTAILAQNLDAFSGGQDARDVPVLTRSDLETGRQELTAQVDEAVNRQAQQERKPGMLLLPLDCQTMFSATHQAGEEAAGSTLTLMKTCTPRAYAAADLALLAQRQIVIPKGYHLVSFSAFVAQSTLTAQGGALTVQAIAYLRQETSAPLRPYPFTGK